MTEKYYNFAPVKYNKTNPTHLSTMKKTLTLCLLMLLALAVKAQTDYSGYYQNLPKPMPEVQAPVIPNNEVRLADMGAVGDGTQLCTDAFAKGISKLTKLGGGRLVVTPGVWLTGPISLKDNIELHVERGAIIMFSPDKRLYFADDAKPGDKAKPCITASKRKNIAITGEGIIDGNGEYWRPVKRGKVSDVEWNQYKRMGGTVSEKGDLWYAHGLKHLANVNDAAEKESTLPNNMVRFTDCENILVQGVMLRNSPKFHLVPQRCKNVIIDGVRIVCPWNAQNGDAIDITNCQNVLIVRSTIDAGDDGICMKGGVGEQGVQAGPCENINIQDNTVLHAHGGFVIGSEFCGGMKNIYVNRCTFAGTDTGLRFKSAVGRGGETSDIYISNITMTDIKDEAIVFQCDYLNNQVGSTQSEDRTDNFVPHFTDIHISGVTCYGTSTGVKAGGQKGMIEGVDISNSTIFYHDKAQDIAADCDVKLTDVNFVTWE